MGLQINRISLSGWLLEDPSMSHNGSCTFPLFQHQYQDTFFKALKDLGAGVHMQVIVNNRAADKCLKYLKRGNRVTVEGRLFPNQINDGKNGIFVIAISVERSEMLDSLKNINEIWHPFHLTVTANKPTRNNPLNTKKSDRV